MLLTQLLFTYIYTLIRFVHKYAQTHSDYQVINKPIFSILIQIYKKQQNFFSLFKIIQFNLTIVSLHLQNVSFLLLLSMKNILGTNKKIKIPNPIN